MKSGGVCVLNRYIQDMESVADMLLPLLLLTWVEESSSISKSLHVLHRRMAPKADTYTESRVSYFDKFSVGVL